MSFFHLVNSLTPSFPSSQVTGVFLQYLLQVMWLWTLGESLVRYARATDAQKGW